MTRIIAICSGKGGVGKTTVAANLAAALVEFGRDIVVVDANVTTPHMVMHLGMPKTKKTLHDVLEGKAKMKQAVYVHPKGIKFVPAGMTLSDLDKKFKKNLSEEIIDLVGEVDMILIDVAAGLGSDALAGIHAASEVLVITNPELPAVTDALKTIQIARKYGCQAVGVVVNKYTGIQHELHPQNITEFLEEPVISVIPNENVVKKAIQKRNPVVFEYPFSKSAIEFKKLAAFIIGETYEFKDEKISFLQMLKKRLFG